MPDTPLNPDALEAASRTVNPGYWKLIDNYPEERIAQKSKSNLIEEAHSTVSAYLAVAQPVAQKLTDAEWQEFQAIPDQGYSHRAWVDARIAERVAVAQPEVTSVEELDQLPEGTILRDSYGLALHKRTANWWVTNGDNNLTSEDLADEIAGTAHTYTVLYRPEVKP